MAKPPSWRWPSRSVGLKTRDRLTWCSEYFQGLNGLSPSAGFLSEFLHSYSLHAFDGKLYGLRSVSCWLSTGEGCYLKQAPVEFQKAVSIAMKLCILHVQAATITKLN